MRKTDKDFERRLEFKDMKSPVKIRYIHKIEKKIVSSSVFWVMRIKKNSHSTFQKILLNLLLIKKKANILNTFIYNQTLHRDRKEFFSLLVAIIYYCTNVTKTC